MVLGYKQSDAHKIPSVAIARRIIVTIVSMTIVNNFVIAESNTNGSDNATITTTATNVVADHSTIYEWIITQLDMISIVHESLPIPIRDMVVKYVLVEDIPDIVLYTVIAILLFTVVTQLKAFTRPKPVPLKRLPKRPIVTISFQPDDISNETMKQLSQKFVGGNSGGVSVTSQNQKQGTSANSSGVKKSTSAASLFRRFATRTPKFNNRQQHKDPLEDTFDDTEREDGDDENETDNDDDDDLNVARAVESVLERAYGGGGGGGQLANDVESSDDEDDDHFQPYKFSKTQSTATAGTTATSTTTNVADLLPDSFAPLLSSSVVDIISNQLTADLIHAASASATVKLRPGIHEIPLDIDSSRPQLRFEVPTVGCKIIAALNIGSDGLTVEQDFNCTTTKNYTTNHDDDEDDTDDDDDVISRNKQVRTKKASGNQSTNKRKNLKATGDDKVNSNNNKPNKKGRNSNKSPDEVIRSKPMVKSGGIVFDPPVPLSNVAPTLIHFPTLFEDLQYLPLLRNIQIIRYCMDFIISISNFLEKCLWIIESKCQIHLSQIRIRPLYKGSGYNNRRGVRSKNNDLLLPEWRLSLSFSGHVTLFGFIPIPFVNIVLPTIIIPQPHALLEYLLSAQPLASARLRREKIAEQRIALAVIGMAESWKTDFKLVATPPAIGIDLNLPGGLGVAMEVGLWRDHQAGNSSGPTGGSSIVGGGKGGGEKNAGTIIVGGPPSLGMKQARSQDLDGIPHPTKKDKRKHRQTGKRYQTSKSGRSKDTMGGDDQNEVDSFYQSEHDDMHSLSSWTTNDNNDTGTLFSSSQQNRHQRVVPNPAFDANEMIPWALDFSAKGSVRHEKMSFHILKLEAKHTDYRNQLKPVESKFETRGSFAVWKYRHNTANNNSNDTNHNEDTKGGDGIHPDLGKHKRTASNTSDNPLLFRHGANPGLIRRRKGNSIHPELESEEDSPSVAAILLFPDETVSYQNDLRMLQYDYVFDVFEDSKIDSVTVSIGATHPMLNGGSIITTILDSIYAFGSFSARENAVLDPNERRRKRNILRHLPATDFTFGIQNIFIPPESNSYSDDGQTLVIPEVEGGRMMVHFLGGLDTSDSNSLASTMTVREAVAEGIKVVADFEIASCSLRSESAVKEFPELDIFPGVKLRSLFSGLIVGSIKAHLRPQHLGNTLSTTGPNVFNPLEAYEIDFSRTSLSVKVKEYSATLGHRRIMFPAESTFLIQVTESVVDMGFEGKTKCDLCWDFQGLSPILQVTKPGMKPETALPENKEQVTLLVAPLRQGRFSLNVSSVGGINITKAATSREDKDGLYDWKFFNALVSPDGESAGRIMDVLHDKRTMDRMLQIVKLLNQDLHKLFEYILQQVWRAKEILDKEGVSDPRHAIPMYKMARLISLFLTGDDDHIDSVLPIVQRLVDGDGIDVVQVKALLRDHLEPNLNEDWAAEIDRAVRFLAVALGPSSSAHPYVEDDVIPLAEVHHHAKKLRGIPSASQLYQMLCDKPQLPLDPSFSNLVNRVAPYLSFRQIEYILQVRASNDWQASDLRRIRYVYSVKRKVQEIAESYGGLSFLPQSFFLSVFLGEATRTSLRASKGRPQKGSNMRRQLLRSPYPDSRVLQRSGKISTMNRLRRRRLEPSINNPSEDSISEMNAFADQALSTSRHADDSVGYELGDSLLGPQDVAILLQAGLTSVMKSSTVVQLNQRMLLDLIGSQPRSFAIAVLAEIGTSSRSLTSALMALLELDQTAFKPSHQIDMHSLLESWLPGIKVPRRDDYMAGGRFARQSYYGAIFSISKSILDDAESYIALKNHLQRVRKSSEKDPLPKPRDETSGSTNDSPGVSSKLREAISLAKSLVAQADAAGSAAMPSLLTDKFSKKQEREYEVIIALYRQAFDACAAVLVLDKHAFCATWFRDFYQRNYDALQVKSVYDNVIDDVDNVRHWMDRLWRAAKKSSLAQVDNNELSKTRSSILERLKQIPDNVFENAHPEKSQMIVDAIIESLMYERSDRDKLRSDPLVRLLIPNPDGIYDLVIISAAGVVTEGKNGTELQDAFARLEKKRGVKVIRADTATARSLEYNASKIEEAIDFAVNKLKKPYGLLGYSQGCANALMAESLLLSGSPQQQQALSKNGGLACRQLLFSAANGSFHGPAMDKKIQNLIAMGEDFFKSQAGYFSRAFSASILETLTSILDSGSFHKLMGGAQSFLEDGCRAFWREAQHLSYVPTCTLRGVEEEHTTPESLEMLSHMLTKQSGSHQHDSQVHVFDAVGHPVYHRNRNAFILKQCDIGAGAIQRTHHWSPLHVEVDFLTTTKDLENAMFDCAKDRHVFPWLDVNVRFGFVKYLPESKKAHEKQPTKIVVESSITRVPQYKSEDWEAC